MKPDEFIARIDETIGQLTDRDTKNIRRVRRAFSKEIASADPRNVVNLGLALLKRGDFTHRFIAYELVAAHRKALKSLNSKTLVQFGAGLNSWETVDTFASYLSGPIWREHQVPDSLIKSWARSPDRWWRRAALVSTVPLNIKARGGNGDPVRTLMICSMLVEDRDDMVEKAMSWALRELAKRDSNAVHDFLASQSGSLGARVLREVRNKLTTGLKNPRGRE